MIVAAIDGGGTKTAVAIATGEAEARPAPLPGCNPQDNPAWSESLDAALALLPPDTAHLVVGMPGWGEVPALDTAVAAQLGTRAPCPVTILNDVALALEGALAGADGVLVLSGTGSMAMANGPLGRGCRAGGWGDLFGDEGSAFWIGQAALRLASRMEDGRAPATPFLPALRGALGLGAGTFALMAHVQAAAHPRSAVAAVARSVDDLAGQHPEAAAILEEAAAHLAEAAGAAARAAGLAPGFDWCAAGSVFGSARLRGAVARHLGRPETPPRQDALSGGLRLARDMAAR